MNMHDVRIGVANLGDHSRAERRRRQGEHGAYTRDRDTVHGLFNGIAIVAGDDHAQIDRLPQFGAEGLYVSFDASFMRRVVLADVQNSEPSSRKGGSRRNGAGGGFDLPYSANHAARFDCFHFWRLPSAGFGFSIRLFDRSKPIGISNFP